MNVKINSFSVLAVRSQSFQFLLGMQKRQEKEETVWRMRLGWSKENTGIKSKRCETVGHPGRLW